MIIMAISDICACRCCCLRYRSTLGDSVGHCRLTRKKTNKKTHICIDNKTEKNYHVYPRRVEALWRNGTGVKSCLLALDRKGTGVKLCLLILHRKGTRINSCLLTLDRKGTEVNSRLLTLKTSTSRSAGTKVCFQTQFNKFLSTGSV